MLLRTTQHTHTDDTSPLHENYVQLVCAIFRCALRDLRHAEYADDALQWLYSEEAAWYAGLLGVDLERMRSLKVNRNNGRKRTNAYRRSARMQTGAAHRNS
jgi:hypothetical protein